MSWLSGPAQAWNSQIRDTLNRASVSVQRLAEQAELQQIGDKVRASAQSLAEQGEAALRDARESVVGQASAMGLLQGEHGDLAGSASPEELAQSFLAEARALKQIAPNSSAPKETFQRWVICLDRDGKPGATALRALHESNALPEALAALTRSKVGRSVLRAGAVTYGCKDVDMTKDLDHDSARWLCRVLKRASAAPDALLGQLLALLAEAARAEAHARSAAFDRSEIDTLKHDKEWVLTLMSAALNHTEEASLAQRLRTIEAVKGSLEASKTMDALTGATPSGQDQATELVENGADVWAQWPGDGHWYHAKVKTVAEKEVEVEWSRPPDDVECGRESEYVFTALGDSTTSSTVPRAVVLPESPTRPAPATATEENWTQQLDAAEELSRGFHDLRAACIELAAPKAHKTKGDGAAAAERTLAATAASLEALRERAAGQLETLPEGGRASGSVAAAASSEEVGHTGEGPKAEEEEPPSSRVTELRREREQLIARVRAIDEELASLGQRVEDSEAPAGLARSTSGDKATTHDRRRFLVGARAASEEVEACLAARRQKVAGFEQAQSELGSQREAVASACLRNEVLRRRRLEEVLSGLHAAAWGPGADALVRDVDRLAAARGTISRAGGLVEHSWREMVQLAAETLGDGGPLIGANSEDMSRAAKRYKEMREQLGSDLDRLAKVESNAAISSSFHPPARG
mmetsp:Transcript_148044/g.369037  ORF Transcript_148044/g.369037 Transcript_148044/m.369037 type:complete len:697 (+) Transcript_148044:106-2196(+)